MSVHSVPVICCAGQRVHVAWDDERDGEGDIYVNTSWDGGRSWMPTEIRLDTDPLGSVDSDDVEICCDSNSVYVVWEEKRNDPDNEDIYLNHSNDGGFTWRSDDVKINTSAGGLADADDAEICCAAGRVFVAWEEDRFLPGRNDIFLNFSEDSGRTWLAFDLRANTDAPGAAERDDVEICCGNDRAAVSWIDFRDGEGDVRVNSGGS